ncbi:ABC transporter permease [Methylobacterium variabile]|jgi:His/Glu/Gln/Arg/opine family amino acid ABC transporter permease subunit|uniref:ABC transporter permease n=1 Tax=Methylobacterium variabile TaxID=298794 RepID=A0A0J6STW5_9HYPH|nr:ABC transporter permease subunit [Methylobacterium variabile]KMO36992.1 ABC transporter permease [Methylobacterium variabile]
MMLQATAAIATAKPVASDRQRLRLRLRRQAVQAAIVLAVAALVIGFGFAVRRGLAKQGIDFNFGYLLAPANINLSEGVTVVFDGARPWLDGFSSSDTNAQAILAGLFNTLKVALIAVVLATVLGTILGVGKLSTNFLLRKLSFGVIEFVRNTPLLIQLVFWYFAVMLKLPPIAQASEWYAGVIASRGGVYLPTLVPAAGATPAAAVALGAATVLAVLALIPVLDRRLRAAALAGAVAATAAAAILGFPLAVEEPVRTRFGASGGISMTPEMAALLLALIVNGAAYLAEIVRGAIEALPRGQWEAAAALGLSRAETIRQIILPQVFRIVLPSFGNQYISLTKSTSLGIAIGYPDLFNVYGTISNQTGRNLEGILIVMLIYLLLSWVISALVNFANARLVAAGAGR